MTTGSIPFHPDAVIRAGDHHYRIVDPDVPHRHQVWRCDRCGHATNPNAPYVECP
jgi:rubrerythrin